jgi:soluble lytic murein transglycosylase-like protein
MALVWGLLQAAPAWALVHDLDESVPAAAAVRTRDAGTEGLTKLILPKAAPGMGAVDRVAEHSPQGPMRVLLPTRTPNELQAAQAVGVPAATTAPVTTSKASPAMLEQIVRGARMQALDPYLVKAVIQAESNFNPGAVSPKNAVGLMQVLPQTAQEIGLKPQGRMGVARLLHDPWVSILVGTRYLSGLVERFGRVDLALAAYNAGPSAVEKAGYRIPPYPETQAYVRKVLNTWRTLRQAQTLAGVS